jgi:hypothetical protein
MANLLNISGQTMGLFFLLLSICFFYCLIKDWKKIKDPVIAYRTVLGAISFFILSLIKFSGC